MDGTGEQRTRPLRQPPYYATEPVVEHPGNKQRPYPLAWHPEASGPGGRIVRNELMEHPVPGQFPGLVKNMEASAA